MQRKRSSPNFDEAGLTLVELLVAAAIAVLFLGLAFQVVVSNRQVYSLDRARTSVNQNLRAALDLIGADIRQAGERLATDFPAIEVIDHGDADELILRRGLLDEVLPVCNKRLSGNQNVIFINQQGNQSGPKLVNPACVRVDADGDGWDDRHEAWRDYRCRQDGVPGCQGNAEERVRVLIYDPVTRDMEWFVYYKDDMSKFHIHKDPHTNQWQHSYPAEHNPRLYLLEERRYRLETTQGMLQLIKNGDESNPLNLVDQIIAFSVSVRMKDGDEYTTFPDPDLNPRVSWAEIEAVKVRVQSQEGYGRNKRVTRTLEGSYFPRNVLSQ